MNAFKFLHLKSNPYGLFFFLLVIFVMSGFIQQHIVFNRDVSWLLEASNRLFLGGNYLQDFYENNPPWVLYFYLPPVMLTHVASIHLFSAFQIYVFLLVIFSLALSYPLIKKIFADDQTLGQIFFVTLAFIFLFIPSHEFGQRDHLLLVGAFPYFLLMVGRLEDWVVNPKLAIAIGILAGSVFLLKPFFIPMMLLLEGALFIKKRRMGSFIRSETIAMFFLGLLYFILIVARHQDYIQEIMPFAYKWCGWGDFEPWIVLITSPLVLFSMLVFFYGALLYYYRYTTLLLVLMLVLLGAFISYFSQRTGWYYHRYPAIAVAILLYIFLLSMQIRLRAQLNTKTIPALTIFYLVLITLFICQNNFLEVTKSAFPLLIFSIFTISFLWMNILFAPTYNKFKIVLTILSLVLFYFIFNRFAEKIHFLMIMLFSLIYLALLFPGTFRQKSVVCFYTGLGVVLITKFFLLLSIDGFYFAGLQANYKPLIDFINEKAADKKVYFFTTEVTNAFPSLLYSNASSASRFSHFWMLAGLVKYERLTGIAPEAKDYLIHLVCEDIEKEAPPLIFIDSTHKKNKFLVYRVAGMSAKRDYFDFNYLDYFLTNQEFRKIWSSYRYLRTIKDPAFSEDNVLKNLYKSYNPYQFDVYERI